jgi:hypothetical protein
MKMHAESWGGRLGVDFSFSVRCYWRDCRNTAGSDQSQARRIGRCCCSVRKPLDPRLKSPSETPIRHTHQNPDLYGTMEKGELLPKPPSVLWTYLVIFVALARSLAQRFSAAFPIFALAEAERAWCSSSLSCRLTGPLRRLMPRSRSVSGEIMRFDFRFCVLHV